MGLVDNKLLLATPIARHSYCSPLLLLATLQAAYGPGDQPNECLEEYFWTGGIVHCVYDQRPVTNDATAALTNVTIQAKEQNDETTAAEPSGGNL
jgi:hypothetical protein